MKFEEILVIAVFVTGFIWLLDALFLKKRREAKANKYVNKHPNPNSDSHLKNVINSSSYAANDNANSNAGTNTKTKTNINTKNLNLVKEPWFVEYSKSFFPVLILVLILRSFIIEPFRIPSGSMRPTLLEGDFIVVNKYNYGLRLPILGNTLIKIGEPKRGDVIVFRHNNKMDLIKRIVAIPGDKISYKDKAIYINGVKVPQEIIGEELDSDASGSIWPVIKKIETVDNGLKHAVYDRVGMPRVNYQYNDIEVPAGYYFVMGDNRDNSIDSRYWGFVPDKNLIGRAFATWISFDFDKYDVRWNRLFKKIN